MSSEERQPESEQPEKSEEPTEKEDTGNEKSTDEFKKPLPKPPTDVEKQQENKLMSRYPGLKAGGGSALLQKRLAKPQKYFDSGDYAMAKAKKAPMPVGTKLPYNPIPVVATGTGEEHPTPETVPTRKASLVHNKLLTRLTWFTSGAHMWKSK